MRRWVLRIFSVLLVLFVVACGAFWVLRSIRAAIRIRLLSSRAVYWRFSTQDLRFAL